MPKLARDFAEDRPASSSSCLAHLLEAVVVGVPGDDGDAEEAGHLQEVLRGRRRAAELLGVAEVDDGGAAVRKVLAQRVRHG